MNEHRFFICRHCGNIVGMINSSGVPLVCCGEEMAELKPNTVEASSEKHLPVVSISGDSVKVSVGSAVHPMSKEHSIQWIYLQTEHGGQRKALLPESAPEACFSLCDDRPAAAYAYCNLHGLWKTEL